MATYYKTEKYNRGVTALANLKPRPFVGRVTEDQIKIALGIEFDIWPAAIADDPQSE